MDETAEQGKFEREIRAGLAFEHLIGASVVGAAVSAAALLVLKNVVLIVEGAWGPASLVQTFSGALIFGFVVFLIAFAAAVVVGTPLFIALEKAKAREIWPFHAAAFFIQFGALSAIFGRAPTFDAPSMLLYFLPGALIVFLFGRSITPLWRAAERGGAAPAIGRIH